MFCLVGFYTGSLALVADAFHYVRSPPLIKVTDGTNQSGIAERYHWIRCCIGCCYCKSLDLSLIVISED